PYTYQWSSGPVVSAASNLCAGTYTLVVSDASGCTDVQSVVITQPGVLAATTSSTQANCGSNNGTATVNASGGTPSYTYAWSNGQTAATATGLVAATYTVVV